jgi:hypothetical protein
MWLTNMIKMFALRSLRLGIFLSFFLPSVLPPFRPSVLSQSISPHERFFSDLWKSGLKVQSAKACGILGSLFVLGRPLEVHQFVNSQFHDLNSEIQFDGKLPSVPFFEILKREKGKDPGTI